MLKDTNPSRTGRRWLKRLLYSQMALRDAVLILFGREQPSLQFQVLAEPASVYFNFPIREDRRQEFERYINLPEDLTLTPIRCLADEDPQLLLTLNVYHVSGIVHGARAEWSTYIRDAEGIPRYMVLEANSDSGSMDPVNLFTRADDLEHNQRDGALQSRVPSIVSGSFTARVPIDETHPKADIAPEWIGANDYIYWRNGICDRSWYDASLFNARVRQVPLDQVTISDTTHWADFVESQPRHVLKYDGGLEFMIAPWFNV